MRWLLLIPASALVSCVAMAQGANTGAETPMPPPAYRPLRFDEDYSPLSRATNRTDWFDPVKYVPLRAGDPAWYLTVGGELRERFEGIYDPNFGIRGLGSDAYLLQRVTL